MESKITNQNATILFDPVMNYNTIHEIKNTLIHVLNKNVPIIISLKEIREIDTAVCQVLLSFVKSAKQKNIFIQWQEPSPAFIQALHVLGMEGFFTFKEGKEDAY